METICLLDSSRGIYIPQQFAIVYGDDCKGLDEKSTEALTESLKVCLFGPNHADYWEAWEEVVDHAILIMDDGEYVLRQDSDLWAVPAGYEEPDED